MDIRAPEEQTEGTRSQVLRWLKAVGDSVAEHEPLIEIETDKVTVEVAAPASGVLREILKAEQEEIAPGEVLGRMEIADAGQAFDTSARAGNQGDRRSTAAAAREERAEGGSAAVAATLVAAANEERVRAGTSLSPAVRRLMAERGLDSTAIRGTGEDGRITV